MRQLSSSGEVDSAVSGETAILYKHSTTCPISAAAHEQMETFLQRNPDAPFYMVDVNASADVSSYLADKTGIDHESPQVIVFRDGKAAWHASHYDITATELEQQLGGAKG